MKNFLSAKSALIAWASILGLVFSLMLSFHFMPHKTPEVTNIPLSFNFTAHHFLNVKCACSKNILKHLENRKAYAGMEEHIYLINADKKNSMRLAAAGYIVNNLDEELAVKKFGIEALPLFLLVKDGQELYKGGYGKDQQHLAIYDDVAIIEKFIHGKDRAPASHPVYGCANGKVRKNILDFWRIKYDK